MLVSWNWLTDYVRLDVSSEELTHRLTMSGLNHEGTLEVGGDLRLDLEVTSNRPDCLGHIGVAREIAVVLGKELKLPEITYDEGAAPASESTSVEVTCPDLCPHYTARLIRGVRVGPSPTWLRQRLETIGIGSINNVVDVSNYVLMECGQPLHAFDHDKLAEGRIVVRRARPGEAIATISHHRFEMTDQMCAICDAQHPVALGGVMGGLDTEVCQDTTNVLIESAAFEPLSIRRTSRALALMSESSFRFERGPDPDGVDWASRRACQLIQQVSGGQVAAGVVAVGGPAPAPSPIRFRLDQIRRVLGVDTSTAEVRRTLCALGCRTEAEADAILVVTPPSSRRDLEREIDLVEEVGRIHGYEHLPGVPRTPVTVAPRSKAERVAALTRDVLTACGYCEAVCFSLAQIDRAETFSPWTSLPAIRVDHRSRRQAAALRKSLVPSLLEARLLNQSRGNQRCQLFEIAKVYLPTDGPDLPAEPVHVALVTGQGFRHAKGVVAVLMEHLGLASHWTIRPWSDPFFADEHGAEALLDGQALGYMGVLSAAEVERQDLHRPCVVAELDLDVLIARASLGVQVAPVPRFPAVDRDLAIVLDEQVSWERLEQVVRASAGPMLESLQLADIYRGEQVPPGKKSVAITMLFRAPDRTLTHEEANVFRDAVLEQCRRSLNAELRT